MPHLALSLLGGVSGALDGEPLSFRSRKVCALMAYLAVEAGRPHRRDALATMLWTEASSMIAHKNLRDTLYWLQRGLHGAGSAAAFVAVTPTEVWFNPASDHEVDVETFTRLVAAVKAHRHPSLDHCELCISRLDQAAKLYRGDFLAGFSLPGAPAYEEWALVKQEELHQLAVDMLARLAAVHLRCRAYEQAIARGQQLLAIEAWQEEAHRIIMQAFALTGQRAAALKQYATCRRILVAEFNVEPEPETKALNKAIRAGTLHGAR